MAKKKTDSGAFDALKKNIEDGQIERLYAFYGEESYLIDDIMRRLRSKIVPEGLEEFNDRRFDGRSLDLQELAAAVDAMPFFSERTLIEVDDYDFSKGGETALAEMLEVLGDLPEYVCVVFVYKTCEFKIDGRYKCGAALKKLFKAVEFALLEQTRLAVWVQRRFAAVGKSIDRQTAEYLVFVSGGLMSSLVSEIEKVASYVGGEQVTRADIDAVVVPSLEATVYNMTDALFDGNSDQAVSALSAMLRMQEPPQKIIYTISQRFRQLLAAKVLVERGRSAAELVDICNMKFEFQAKGLVRFARRVSMNWCREAVTLCSDAAYRLNSSSAVSGADVLSELVIKLATGTGERT